MLLVVFWGWHLSAEEILGVVRFVMKWSFFISPLHLCVCVSIHLFVHATLLLKHWRARVGETGSSISSLLACSDSLILLTLLSSCILPSHFTGALLSSTTYHELLYIHSLPAILSTFLDHISPSRSFNHSSFHFFSLCFS